ncbi:hypothetical protein IKD67_01860 [Candidatus Saccharibacteria bacterium]|nr:hypothetical protein [Candidatus Saccharibacteria bacterium]
MKELNPLLIKDDTKPTWESDVAKWYLIQKGEYFSIWRWDSKKDKRDRTFLIIDNERRGAVFDDTNLENICYMFDFYEFEAKEEYGKKS